MASAHAGSAGPRNRVSGAHPALLAMAVATAGAVLWLLLEPTGGDLSAQQVHARFVAEHGFVPVDMLWFGGTDWYGYSLLVPPVAAVVGTVAVGAVATVAAAAEFGGLLSAWRVRRAQLGAVVGAVALVANLIVGRITFAVGVALGLGCLRLLTARYRARRPLAGVGAVITCAASPLAGLFLGLVATTMLLRGRRVDAVVVGGGVALMLATEFWLGQNGRMPMDVSDVIRGVVAAALVAVGSASRSVRTGAVLSGAGVLVAWLVPSPVGVNAVRLLAIFGAAAMVATSGLSRKVVVALAAAVLLIVPPITPDQVIGIGDDQNSGAYFRPLIRELRTLPLTGRLEIPPLRQRWETYYVSPTMPLARGWMTQLDHLFNPLFFDGTVDAASYRRWLLENAVQYVAVAEGAPASAGSAERGLVRDGLPYLRAIWSSRFWTLFAVDGARPTVARPGSHIVQSATTVGFHAPATGSYEVHLRWSRWLTLTGPGGCLRPTGEWLTVDVERPGDYRISSATQPGAAHRVCRSVP